MSGPSLSKRKHRHRANQRAVKQIDVLPDKAKDIWAELTKWADDASKAGAHEAAQTLYQRAFDVADDLDGACYFTAYSAMGVAYSSMRRSSYREALAAYKQAFDCSSRRGNALPIVNAAIGVAMSLCNLHKFDQAATLMQSCLRKLNTEGLNIKLPLTLELSKCYSRKADHMIRLRKYQAGFDAFHQAQLPLKKVRINEREMMSRFQRERARCLAGMAMVALRKKRIRQGLKYISESLDIYNEFPASTKDMYAYLVDLIEAAMITPAHQNMHHELLGRLMQLARRDLKIPAAPQTEIQELKEKLFDIEVADHYRWLEDINAEKTKEWMNLQRDLSQTFFDRILIGQRALQMSLWQHFQLQPYEVPHKHSSYYYFKKWGDGRQPVLYRSTKLTDGVSNSSRTTKVVVDPNTFADGHWLDEYSISPDGKLLAMGLSVHGSDWQEWRIKPFGKKAELPDKIIGIRKRTIVWSPKSDGFFYIDFPYPPTDPLSVIQGPKLRFHKLGDLQSKDKLIFEPNRPDDYLGCAQTSDEKHLIVFVWAARSLNNKVFLRSLAPKKEPLFELFGEQEGRYAYCATISGEHYFVTDHEAPRGKLIAVKIAGDKTTQRTVVHQSDDTLRAAECTKDGWILHYLHHGLSRLKFVPHAKNDKTQKPSSIKLPFKGVVAHLSGDVETSELFFELSNPVTPSTIFCLSTQKQKVLLKPVFQPKESAILNGEFMMAQEMVKGNGVEFPVYLVHKKGLKRSGTTPTLIQAYGGFNVLNCPEFRSNLVPFLQLEGMLAFPLLRGGGEYGFDWHKSGVKGGKIDVVGDLIATAECLIDRGYTSPSKLAITGGSNGGLVAARAMVTRPDLFAAVFIQNALCDMTRFHKFTFGWTWMSEYGDPEDQAEFTQLHTLSPLHQIKPGVKYPATLICASLNDDRVVPLHSFKFAAALQAAQGGTAPIILRTDEGGHGRSTVKTSSTTDIWMFLADVLGLDLRVVNHKK